MQLLYSLCAAVRVRRQGSKTSLPGEPKLVRARGLRIIGPPSWLIVPLRELSFQPFKAIPTYSNGYTSRWSVLRPHRVLRDQYASQGTSCRCNIDCGRWIIQQPDQKLDTSVPQTSPEKFNEIVTSKHRAFPVTGGNSATNGPDNAEHSVNSRRRSAIGPDN